MDSERPLDDDSTLVIRAHEAKTFQAMIDFASLLEARPLEGVIEDLPSIAQLSRSKFDLALQVLRRRLRQEPSDVRLVRVADAVARRTVDENVRAAILGLFA